MKKLNLLSICCFMTVFIYAQPVDYIVNIAQIKWYDGGLGGACYEAGAEDYRALAWFNDNLNAINTGGDCFTCGNNGDCTVTPNVVIGGRNSTCAETINIIFQGFENDGGASCEADGGDDCKCGPDVVASINFRNSGLGCQIYGPFGCSGSHNIWVQICWNYSTPVNNNCTNPITVNAGSENFILSEQCSGTDITSCTSNDYKSIWHKYTVGNNYLKTLQIDTENSNFDTALSLFDACGGSEVACDDDGGNGTLSKIMLDCVPPGTAYYIRVSGYNGAYGTGTLNITESLDNVTTINSPVHTNIINGADYVAIPPCLRPVFIE